MYYYSIESKEKLGQCHSVLQIVFSEVIRSFDNSIICGHRSQPEQAEAFRKGFSKVCFPDSGHNQIPAMAVDAIPYPVDWNDRERFIYFAGHVKGVFNTLKSNKSLKELFAPYELVWGGDWDSDSDLKDQIFMDLAHYELRKTK